MSKECIHFFGPLCIDRFSPFCEILYSYCGVAGDLYRLEFLPCRLVYRYWGCGISYRLDLQCQAIKWFLTPFGLVNSFRRFEGTAVLWGVGNYWLVHTTWHACRRQSSVAVIFTSQTNCRYLRRSCRRCVTVTVSCWQGTNCRSVTVTVSCWQGTNCRSVTATVSCWQGLVLDEFAW